MILYKYMVKNIVLLSLLVLSFNLAHAQSNKRPCIKGKDKTCREIAIDCPPPPLGYKYCNAKMSGCINEKLTCGKVTPENRRCSAWLNL